MFTPSVLLSVLLLTFLSTLAAHREIHAVMIDGEHSNVYCESETTTRERINIPKPDPADCQVAINMIPSGKYDWDHRVSQPLNFHRRPPNVRDRKFFVPAAFVSGTCLVLVGAYFL